MYIKHSSQCIFSCFSNFITIDLRNSISVNLTSKSATNLFPGLLWLHPFLDYYNYYYILKCILTKAVQKTNCIFVIGCFRGASFKYLKFN